MEDEHVFTGRDVVSGNVDAPGGVPHKGNSFRFMAIDIQTARGGKIFKTFHMGIG